MEKINKQHLTHRLSLLVLVLLLATISVTVNRAINKQDSRSSAQGETGTFPAKYKQIDEILPTSSIQPVIVTPGINLQSISEDIIPVVSVIVILMLIILGTIKLMHPKPPHKAKTEEK